MLYDNANTNPLTKQISNATTRLNATGIDPRVALDNRNWFEKATNLPQNQNWFFDIMNILGRPQQGLFNIIDDSLSGRNRNPLDALTQGLSGNRRVTGTELMKQAGVDSKAAGITLDFLLDPINFVPGAVLAKPFTGSAKLTGSLAKGGIKAVDNFAPNFKLGEKTEDFLSMFDRNRGLKPETVTRRDQYEADDRFLGQKIHDQNVRAANKVGVEAGPLVGREMEKGLKVNYDPLDVLKQLTSNKTIQPLRVNKLSPELSKFMDDINKQMKSSPVFIERLAKERQKLESVNRELAKTFNKYNIPDIAKRVKNNEPVSKLEQKVFKGVQTKNRKKKEFESFIKNFQQGVKAKPLDNIVDDVTGKARPRGFEVDLAHPGIARKIVEDKEQFLDKISPKKSFDEATNNDPKLRSLMEDLLVSGSTKVRKADTHMLDSLKTLFGDKVSLDRGGKINDHISFTPKGLDEYQTVNSVDDIELVDRIKNIEGQRPDRNYIDPQNATPEQQKILSVANRMMASNKEIHTLAKENNLNVNQIESYMTHIWSEEKKSREAKAQVSGKATMGGNKSVVKERSLKGSVEDINELKNEDFFQMNAFFSTAIGQNRFKDYVLAESFKNDVLKIEGRIHKGGPIGEKEVLITPDRYNFFKTDGGQLSVKKGESYVVPRKVAQMLDSLNGRIKDDGVNGFVKAYDSAMNVWKNFVLLSPGYHIRNDIGAGFNMWIAGMNTRSIMSNKMVSTKTILKYNKVYADVSGKVGKHQDYRYWDEFRKEGMVGTSFAQAEFRFASTQQEQAFMKAIEEGNASAIKKYMPNNWFKRSQELSQFVDTVNKFAMYRWLRDTKGFSPKQAKVKTLDTLFDYNDLTQFEQTIAKRTLPFYTWMKKNAVFQIKNLMNNPKKYYQFNKALDASYEATGVDKENVPDWMRNNMHVPFMKGDNTGDARFANVGTPASDLGKLADPLKMLMEGLTPAIKMPYELNANFNSFTGRPIEDFEGQTKNLLGMDLPAKLDHLLRGFGLPNTLDRAVKGEGDLSGMTRYFDNEKGKISKQFDVMKQLSDLMKKYEQDTGNKAPTLAELGR